MPRPKTKSDLLAASQEGFAALMELVDSMSEAEREAAFPEGTLNRNVRDVLAHLHHWHRLLLGWYESGMAGEKPEVPAPGYTWKDTPTLNRDIHARYQAVELADIRVRVEQSHRHVQAIIERHSEEELFEKKRYPWTGSTSMGAYLVSSTSSHYDWARHLIRKAKR